MPVKKGYTRITVTIPDNTLLILKTVCDMNHTTKSKAIQFAIEDAFIYDEKNDKDAALKDAIREIRV